MPMDMMRPPMVADAPMMGTMAPPLNTVLPPEIEDAIQAEQDAKASGADEFLALPENLAGNKKLVDFALDEIKKYYNRFNAQSARTTMKAKLKIADAMLRVTKRRRVTDATDQQEKTRSNVSSTSFYDAHRVIVAGQRSVIFYGEELPVKYEARPCDPKQAATAAEARRVAEEQNLLLRYTWDQANVEKTLKKALSYNIKYGQEMLCGSWNLTEEERVERDSQGKPVKMLRPVCDWPDFERCDLRQMWYDMQIDDMQLQNCILRYIPQNPREVLEIGKTGFRQYMNLNKLTDSHLFRPDQSTGTTETEDLQENAGESPETQETGNYGLWYNWVRLPIVKKGKKWVRDDKAVPQWFETTFTGSINGDCVCLQLRANPYWHRKNPYNLIHSHEDDKGAFHMGYATILETLFEEETTTINQLIDNNTWRQRAPLIGEQGNLLDRKPVLSPNKIVWVRPGTGLTALHRLEIPDTTGTAIPTLQWIERRFKTTAGANDPISGEEMKSRTTATAAQATMQQAMKPAIEESEYVSDQMLPWVAWWTAETWRQFGDPERAIWVTYGGTTRSIKPTKLYGEYNIRVVSIGQFQSDTLRQALDNDFLARVIPIAVQTGAMTKEGVREFLRDVMISQKRPNVNKYLQPGDDYYDAERVAWNENQEIILAGMQTMPTPRDNDMAHLRAHQPYLNLCKTMPPDEIDQNRVRSMERHILIHEQQAEKKNAMMQATAGSNQFGPEPATMIGEIPQSAGEQIGDTAGGEMGGMTGGG